VAGIVAASIAARKRTSFEAGRLRRPGAPYTLEGESVRNSFELHLVNKRSARETFVLSARAPGEVILPMTSVTLEPLADRHVPLFVVMPRTASGEVVVEVRAGSETAVKTAPLLGGAR
jgi:hypothetical protein